MNAPIVDHFIKEKEDKNPTGIKESESLKALRILAQSGTYKGMSEVHQEIIEHTQSARNISIVTSALSLTVITLGLLVMLAKSFFIDMSWSTNNLGFYIVVILISVPSFYYMLKFVKGVESIKQKKGDSAVKSFALKLTDKKAKRGINLSFWSAFFITISMIYMSYSGAMQIGDYAKDMQIDKEEMSKDIETSSAYKVLESAQSDTGDKTLDAMMNGDTNIKLAEMIEQGIANKEAPINRTVYGFLILSVAVEIVAILAPIFLYHILKNIPTRERDAIVKTIYQTDKKVLNINNKIQQALIDKEAEKMAKKHGISLSSKVVDINNNQEIIRALFKEGAVIPDSKDLESRRLLSVRKIFTSSAQREEINRRIIKPLAGANYIERVGNTYYTKVPMNEVLDAFRVAEEEQKFNKAGV